MPFIMAQSLKTTHWTVTLLHSSDNQQRQTFDHIPYANLSLGSNFISVKGWLNRKKMPHQPHEKSILFTPSKTVQVVNPPVDYIAAMHISPSTQPDIFNLIWFVLWYQVLAGCTAEGHSQMCLTKDSVISATPGECLTLNWFSWGRKARLLRILQVDSNPRLKLDCTGAYISGNAALTRLQTILAFRRYRIWVSWGRSLYGQPFCRGMPFFITKCKITMHTLSKDEEHS